MMVGREVLLRVNKTPANPGPTVLHVEDVHTLSDRGLEALHGINFDLRSGEILGIAGVEGNGQIRANRGIDWYAQAYER